MTYADVASEYYDARLHPTCDNFRELSVQFFRNQLSGLTQSARIIEVGAGASIVAPILHGQGLQLYNLTLLDASSEMLEHSSSWIGMGAASVIADACRTGLPSRGFDILVASLADPYNSKGFWDESFRLMARGGLCLVTLPSPQWVYAFRREGDQTRADFVRQDGQEVSLPSFVPSLEVQAEMIAQSGFELEAVCGYGTDRLSGPVSPKLLVAQFDSVVNGFAARRSD